LGVKVDLLTVASTRPLIGERMGAILEREGRAQGLEEGLSHILALDGGGKLL